MQKRCMPMRQDCASKKAHIILSSSSNVYFYFRLTNKTNTGTPTYAEACKLKKKYLSNRIHAPRE